MFTNEEIKQALADYRRQKRVAYFRAKGAIAKRKRLLSQRTDQLPALKPAADVARSSGVAPLPVGGESAKPPLLASPGCALPGNVVEGNNTILGRKAMPERDGENKAQTDPLRSSSICD